MLFDILGDEGNPGINGNNGESGGNIYVRAREIRNGQNLKIISNGGNGSNGGDGGKGRDGRNGKDGATLSKREFDKKFPRVTYFDGIADFYEIRGRMEISYSTYSYKNHFLAQHVEGWLEISGNRHDIVLCYCQEKSHRSSYLLVKGASGGTTTGTPGGDGGQGGKAGQGGYSGTIDFDVENIQSSETPKILQMNGVDGKNGKDGEGGIGGRNGVKGKDNLRIENTKQNILKHYHGYFKINYEDNNAGGCSSYCLYNNGYARKSDQKTPPQSRQHSGTKGRRKNWCKKIEVHRKTPISKAEVNSIYNELLNEDSSYHF